MKKHPLSVIQENDVELFQALTGAGSLALQDGALSAKYKLLTALALDATQGTADGVRTLALQAITAGATKEEIFETLRVAYYICGVGCVYTAAEGLNELLNGSESL
jgi:alkylhydroperoxidase/carboxymuconolactone decarboxylase family protein YurZ